MIKRILGIIFIIISFIFCLGFLTQLTKIIGAFTSDSFGYLIGFTIGSFISLVIALIFFKLGLKLLKNTPKDLETIDQIEGNQHKQPK